MTSTEEGALKRKHDELELDTKNGEKSGDEVENESNKKIQKTSDLDIAETPFIVSLGTDLVEIRVGPQEKSFWISKKLLCAKIPYFDKMFKGGFKEASDRWATLPEERPRLFDVLVEWVYTGNIKPLTDVSSGEKNKRVKRDYHPFSMYILLERYCLLDLLDPLMDMMRKIYATRKIQFTSPRNLKLAYSKSSDSSPLRRLVAQSVYYTLVKYKSIPGDPKETSRIQSRLEEVDGLLRDVLDLMRGQSGKVARDPCTGPNCDFHRHGKDEACPLKGEHSSAIDNNYASSDTSSDDN